MTDNNSVKRREGGGKGESSIGGCVCMPEACVHDGEGGGGEKGQSKHGSHGEGSMAEAAGRPVQRRQPRGGGEAAKYGSCSGGRRSR